MRWILASAILCSVMAVCGILIPGSAMADDSVVARQHLTIERGLDFLQLKAAKWRQKKSCSTCHHGTMTMWVQLEARSRGFAVADDRPVRIF